MPAGGDARPGPDPRLVIADEPTSALDAPCRPWSDPLRRSPAGRARVCSVSHDLGRRSTYCRAHGGASAGRAAARPTGALARPREDHTRRLVMARPIRPCRSPAAKRRRPQAVEGVRVDAAGPCRPRRRCRAHASIEGWRTISQPTLRPRGDALRMQASDRVAAAVICACRPEQPHPLPRIGRPPAVTGPHRQPQWCGAPGSNRFG